MRHGGDSYAYGDASWQQHQQQHPPEPPPEPMTWGLLAAWTVTVLCLALGLIWLNRKMEAAARSRRAAEEQAEADRLSRMQELRLKGLEQLRREIQETEEEAARRKAAAGGAKAAEEAAAAQAAEAKKRMRILVAQGELDETAARSQQEVAEAAEAASARSGAAREDAAAALEALEAARRDARDGAQAALSEASAVAAQSRTGTAGSSAAGVQLSSGHSAARAERGAAVFIENKQAELAAATAARERAKHAAALQKLEQRAEEIERQRLLTEAEERRRAEAAASASAYAEAASRSPAVTWGGTGVSVGMGGGVGAVAGPAAGPSPEETARAAARRELLRQQDAEFAESLNRDRDRAAAATRAAELAAAAAAAQDLAMRRHGSLRAKWLATPEPPQGAPGAFAIAIRYPDGSQARPCMLLEAPMSLAVLRVQRPLPRVCGRLAALSRTWCPLSSASCAGPAEALLCGDAGGGV